MSLSGAWYLGLAAVVFSIGALGLLGSDDTALKLTPLVRAWPGESQHQRWKGHHQIGQCGERAVDPASQVPGNDADDEPERHHEQRNDGHQA